MDGHRVIIADPTRTERAPRLRVLVWGDGPWAADSVRRLADDGHTIVGVVPRRRPTDDSVERAAAAVAAPLLRVQDPNAAETIAAARALCPDVALSVAYDRRLHPAVLALPPLGTLNVHAGMLPRYRGRNPINWAIANGEREVGVTVHFMDEGLDTGDVVDQRALPVDDTDDYGSVLARVVALVPELASGAVAAVASGCAVRRPQAHELGSYCRARGPDDEVIDWEAPASRIHDLVRAIARPAPGARTRLGDRTLRIWRARPGPELHVRGGAPGRVVACGPAGAHVLTGCGTLHVLEATHDDASAVTWRIGCLLGAATREREVVHA